MVPIEAHLVLNHVPLVGLVFSLVFFVAGFSRQVEGEVARAEPEAHARHQQRRPEGHALLSRHREPVTVRTRWDTNMP